MANENVELMRGEPEKAVRKLAVPIMISMILTALYNIIDGIWVAGLGQTAIAGIGFVTPIFMVLNGARTVQQAVLQDLSEQKTTKKQMMLQHSH